MKKWWMIGMLMGLAASALAQGNKHEALAGEWTFKTVGTWAKPGKFGGTPENFTRTFTLTYDPREKTFSGQVFGWAITGTKVSSASPGGRVAFDTIYSPPKEEELAVEWSGKMSEDGASILEGQFKCKTGRGTFTAEKKTGGIAPAPGPAAPAPVAPGGAPVR